MSIKVFIVRGINIPAPAAWNTLAISKTAKLGETAAITVPTVNNDIAAMYSCLVVNRFIK